MPISPQEEYLIKLIREAKPYEVIEIHKDKDGRADSYLIKRSQKILVSQVAILEVK